MPSEFRRRILTKSLELASLIGSYLLGVYLRLKPALSYGISLTADDPLLHYRMTKYVVEMGRLPAKDLLSWQPWGYDPSKVLPPLHYYTGAFLYKIVSLIFPNLSLYDFTALIPAFFAPLAIFPIYFIARDLWGKESAIFSAFALSSITAYIVRSHVGFYRHEQFTIPFICLSLMFTIKSMRSEEEWKSLLYAGLSGIALLYVAGSWAAFRFLFDGYAVYFLMLLILDKVNRKREYALLVPSLYVLASSFGLLSNLTLRKQYLRVDSLPVYGALLTALVYETIPRINFLKRISRKIKANFLAIAISAGIVVLMLVAGLAIPLTARLMRVILPSTTLPRGNVVETVMEHAPGATEYVLRNQFGFLLVPFMAGFVLLILERWRHVEDMLILFFAFLSMYFALSIVRLPPLASPFFCLVSSYSVHWIANWTSKKIEFVSRRRRYLRKKGKRLKSSYVISEIAPALLMISFIVVGPLTHSIYASFQFSKFKPNFIELDEEWMNAIGWLTENAEPGTVVMSWWDYGYWIIFASNESFRVLVDGLTINSTQIRQVARAFTGTEEEALDVAMRFNVSYVIILDVEVGSDTYYDPNTGNTFFRPFDGMGKWMPMAWIAKKFEYSPWRDSKFWTEEYPSYFIVKRNPTTGKIEEVRPTYKTINMTLFKLFGSYYNLTQPRYFELVHSEIRKAKLTSREGGTFDYEWPHVLIFKVKAP